MPDPAPLLQSQKNEVFLLVQESALDPSAFAWDTWLSENTEGAQVSVLIHQQSGYWFLFDRLTGKHWCAFSPGAEELRQERYPGSWPMLLDAVRMWLGYLKRETESPDLWAMLGEENALSAAASAELYGENTPFTAEERKRVEASLTEVRSLLIASHSINSEMLGHIDARLEYLEQASERLGRKDWLNVAFSVITNIIIVVAVPPETARNILNVAGAVLSWVMGGSPLLPSALH
jgi:hypothetical protein